MVCLLGLSVFSILGEFNVLIFLSAFASCILSVPIYVILGMANSDKIDIIHQALLALGGVEKPRANQPPVLHFSKHGNLKAQIKVLANPKSEGRVAHWYDSYLQKRQFFFEYQENEKTKIFKRATIMMPGCVVKVVKTKKGGVWRPKNYLTIESERALFGTQKKLFLFFQQPSEMEQWYYALTRAAAAPNTPVPVSSLTPVIDDQSGLAIDHINGLKQRYASLRRVFTPSTEIHLFRQLAMSLFAGEFSHVMRTSWFTQLTHRFFYGYFNDSRFLDLVTKKLTKKFGKIRFPDIIRSFSITDVKFGPNLPHFDNAQLLKLGNDGSMTLGFSVSYRGGIRACLGLQVENQIFSYVFDKTIIPAAFTFKLDHLEGNLVVKLLAPPSDQLWYAFTEEPRIKLHIETEVGIGEKGNTFLPRVGKMLKKLLINEVMEKMVLPNMDNIGLLTKDGWGETYKTAWEWAPDAQRTPTDLPLMEYKKSKKQIEAEKINFDFNKTLPAIPKSPPTDLLGSQSLSERSSEFSVSPTSPSSSLLSGSGHLGSFGLGLSPPTTARDVTPTTASSSATNSFTSSAINSNPLLRAPGNNVVSLTQSGHVTQPQQIKSTEELLHDLEVSTAMENEDAMLHGRPVKSDARSVSPSPSVPSRLQHANAVEQQQQQSNTNGLPSSSSKLTGIGLTTDASAISPSTTPLGNATVSNSSDFLSTLLPPMLPERNSPQPVNRSSGLGVMDSVKLHDAINRDEDTIFSTPVVSPQPTPVLPPINYATTQSWTANPTSVQPTPTPTSVNPPSIPPPLPHRTISAPTPVVVDNPYDSSNYLAPNGARKGSFASHTTANPYDHSNYTRTTDTSSAISSRKDDYSMDSIFSSVSSPPVSQPPPRPHSNPPPSYSSPVSTPFSTTATTSNNNNNNGILPVLPPYSSASSPLASPTLSQSQPLSPVRPSSPPPIYTPSPTISHSSNPLSHHHSHSSSTLLQSGFTAQNYLAGEQHLAALNLRSSHSYQPPPIQQIASSPNLYASTSQSTSQQQQPISSPPSLPMYSPPLNQYSESHQQQPPMLPAYSALTTPTTPSVTNYQPNLAQSNPTPTTTSFDQLSPRSLPAYSSNSTNYHNGTISHDYSAASLLNTVVPLNPTTTSMGYNSSNNALKSPPPLPPYSGPPPSYSAANGTATATLPSVPSDSLSVSTPTSPPLPAYSSPIRPQSVNLSASQHSSTASMPSLPPYSASASHHLPSTTTQFSSSSYTAYPSSSTASTTSAQAIPPSPSVAIFGSSNATSTSTIVTSIPLVPTVKRQSVDLAFDDDDGDDLFGSGGGSLNSNRGFFRSHSPSRLRSHQQTPPMANSASMTAMSPPSTASSLIPTTIAIPSQLQQQATSPISGNSLSVSGSSVSSLNANNLYSVPDPSPRRQQLHPLEKASSLTAPLPSSQPINIPVAPNNTNNNSAESASSNVLNNGTGNVSDVTANLGANHSIQHVPMTSNSSASSMSASSSLDRYSSLTSLTDNKNASNNSNGGSSGANSRRNTAEIDEDEDGEFFFGSIPKTFWGSKEKPKSTRELPDSPKEDSTKTAVKEAFRGGLNSLIRKIDENEQGSVDEESSMKKIKEGLLSFGKFIDNV